MEQQQSTTKFYESPSYLGYANDPDMVDDKRQEKWEKQYNERGFDDTCTWSFDDTLIRFITPRLKRFLEISEEITQADEFHADVRKMLEGFEFYMSGKFNDCDMEHNKVLDESFALLAKNHRGLWW